MYRLSDRNHLSGQQYPLAVCVSSLRQESLVWTAVLTGCLCIVPQTGITCLDSSTHWLFVYRLSDRNHLSGQQYSLAVCVSSLRQESLVRTAVLTGCLCIVPQTGITCQDSSTHWLFVYRPSDRNHLSGQQYSLAVCVSSLRQESLVRTAVLTGCLCIVSQTGITCQDSSTHRLFVYRLSDRNHLSGQQYSLAVCVSSLRQESLVWTAVLTGCLCTVSQTGITCLDSSTHRLFVYRPSDRNHLSGQQYSLAVCVSPLRQESLVWTAVLTGCLCIVSQTGITCLDSSTHWLFVYRPSDRNHLSGQQYSLAVCVSSLRQESLVRTAVLTGCLCIVPQTGITCQDSSTHRLFVYRLSDRNHLSGQQYSPAVCVPSLRQESLVWTAVLTGCLCTVSQIGITCQDSSTHWLVVYRLSDRNHLSGQQHSLAVCVSSLRQESLVWTAVPTGCLCTVPQTGITCLALVWTAVLTGCLCIVPQTGITCLDSSTHWLFVYRPSDRNHLSGQQYSLAVCVSSLRQESLVWTAVPTGCLCTVPQTGITCLDSSTHWLFVYRPSDRNHLSGQQYSLAVCVSSLRQESLVRTAVLTGCLCIVPQTGITCLDSSTHWLFVYRLSDRNHLSTRVKCQAAVL